jgi:hypothetical protein
MLPALHDVAMLGSGAVATADGGATVVICTPSGFKRVALADLPGADDSSRKAPGKAPFCPMCQAVQATATALAPPGNAMLAQAPRVGLASFALFDERLIKRAHSSGLKARAPPIA